MKMNPCGYFQASAAKQSRNGRAVKTFRLGLQQFDYTPCITQTRRMPEIASPRLPAMARNDLWGLRGPAGKPASHETSYFHVNDWSDRPSRVALSSDTRCLRHS
jgi:hypothetical protein